MLLYSSRKVKNTLKWFDICLSRFIYRNHKLTGKAKLTVYVSMCVNRRTHAYTCLPGVVSEIYTRVHVIIHLNTDKTVPLRKTITLPFDTTSSGGKKDLKQKTPNTSSSQTWVSHRPPPPTPTPLPSRHMSIGLWQSIDHSIQKPAVSLKTGNKPSVFTFISRSVCVLNGA